MRRVLLGEFGDIAALALRHLLEVEGLAVVGEAAGAEIIRFADEIRPDVLLLDHDHPATNGIAAEVCDRLPAVTVIAWSTDEPLMRVFPAGHSGESHIWPLTVDLLTAALNDVKTGPVSLAGLPALSRRDPTAAAPAALDQSSLEATHTGQDRPTRGDGDGP